MTCNYPCPAAFPSYVDVSRSHAHHCVFISLSGSTIRSLSDSSTLTWSSGTSTLHRCQYSSSPCRSGCAYVKPLMVANVLTIFPPAASAFCLALWRRQRLRSTMVRVARESYSSIFCLSTPSLSITCSSLSVSRQTVEVCIANVVGRHGVFVTAEYCW
jgi:hypothetical protein